MVLTTHSVVGASVAKIAGINPLAGFVCGLLSHYFIDSITHWDYKLKSSNEADDPAERVLTIGKNFYFDLLKIGLDLALGIFLVFLFFGKTVDPYILLSGIFGGILPDFLQFLFFKFKTSHTYLSTIRIIMQGFQQKFFIYF
jgi:hypothetical protein